VKIVIGKRRKSVQKKEKIGKIGWFNKYHLARMKRSASREVLRFFAIAMGAIISGISTAVFFIPNHIAPGGLNSIGIVLNSAFGFSVGISYLVMNTPFFVWALFLLGYRYLIRTAFAIVIFTVTIDVTSSLLATSYIGSLPLNDLILASVFGGALSGVGIGIVYKNGGSLGGTDVISQLIHFSTGVPYGTVVLMLDSLMILVLTTYFVIFPSSPGVSSPDLSQVRLALYSGISMFVLSRVIDTVQAGMTAIKMVMIITNNLDPIRMAILHRIDKGVTIVEAMGGYSMEKKNMIMCAVPRSQLSRLKELVMGLDSSAFIMVTNLSETKGKGFERKLPK